MFGRKKVLMNSAPGGYWCPACKCADVAKISGGMMSDRYACPACGLVFEANRDMDAEEYADECDDCAGPVSIIWSKSSAPMDAVRMIACRLNPNIRKVAYDNEVFAWICSYWDYVRWNEHGNELSYDELAYDNGFSDIVGAIIYDPSDFLEYLRSGDSDQSEEERKLAAELRRLNRRLNP